MTWFNPFRRRESDADIDLELASHLEMAIRDRIERGESPEDARRAALLEFGSVRLVREDTRAVWTWTAVEQLVDDLRAGARILTKSPGLSATAVALVALVIGGNTTVFSMVHGILRKPAAGVRAERLVTPSWVDDKGWIETHTSYANYLDLRSHSTTLSTLSAVDAARFTLVHEQGSYAVFGGLASSNYFDNLGVRFAMGRDFTSAEHESPTSGLVAIVSHRVWQQQFDGASDIIGKPVVLSGHPATVVGVTEPLFRGAKLGEPTDFWVPLESYSRMAGNDAALLARQGLGVSLIGTLAPGRSLAEARTELAAFWARLQAAHPEVDQKYKLTLVPYSAIAGGNSLVAAQGDRFLAIFSVVTLLTLFIVCANVANLLIARGVIRQREIALRQSLGASRLRIVRMLLAEGLALAIVAWAAAFLFAWWFGRATSGFMPPSSQGDGVMLPDFMPDWVVAGYALALAGVGMLAFTLAPALRASRLQLLPLLKTGEQGIVRARSRLSNALVVVQLAFSVLLLTCAGLAFHSLYLVDSLDLGFQTNRLLLVTINTTGSVSTPEANAALIETAAERLRGVPGIDDAAYARYPIRESGWSRSSVRAVASSEPVNAQQNHVGPDYLQTLGLLPLAGREFTRQERARDVPPAIITQDLADTLWPGESPLGRRFLVGRPPGREGESRSEESSAGGREVEVVGVAPNARYNGVGRDRLRFIFLSAQQEPDAPGEATFYVRHSGSLDVIGPAIRRTLRDVEARAPIVFMRTVDTQLHNIRWPVRVLTTLLILFAGGSFFIATIGQYAVVSFDMRRRIREFALRMALGASARQVLRSVVREGFRLTAIGLAIGFVLSVAAGRGLSAVLYGVTATDPLTYAAVFALLSLASILACYLPARRAARVDPMTTLRHE